MVRGGLVLASRRGMSPLIATVLLMAFAVALGGMIMNWSVEIGVNDECVDLSKHVTVSQFCLQDDNIVLRARSGSETPPVQGIRLTVLTGNIENSVNVKNSELEPGEELSLSIPVSVQGDARVDLIGIVGPKGKPFVCSEDPIERVDPIQPC